VDTNGAVYLSLNGSRCIVKGGKREGGREEGGREGGREQGLGNK